MSVFTITRLGQSHEWSGKHGPMVDYWLAATDGTQDVWCFTTRKPESPAPIVGEQLYGHLEDQGKSQAGKDKIKLIKDQPPDGALPLAAPQAGSPPLQASSGSRPAVASSGSGATTPSFDQRSARIERQHSQEMALRAVAFAVHADPGVVTESPDILKAAITNWTDWFCADLDSYEASKKPSPQSKEVAENGDGGQAGPESPVLPASLPEAERLTGIASNFDDAQVRLRLVAAGATDVSDIGKAIEHLNADQAKLFEKALEDIAAEEIQQAVEDTHDAGPSEDDTPAAAALADDDSIPF